MKSDAQIQIVLSHLRKATITSKEAFSLYDITRLAARIHELRKVGYSIRTKLEKNKHTRFARYSLMRKH